MTSKLPVNIAASIHGRLLARAKRTGADFHAELVRYGNERLLARIAASEYAATFVLKGATLFALWASTPYRPTRDIDLHGSGSNAPNDLARVFRAICAQDFADKTASCSTATRSLRRSSAKTRSTKAPASQWLRRWARQESHFRSTSGDVLAEAVRQTFERRRTQLPVTAPLALTAVFGHDAVKRTQWRAFLNKANLEAPDLELVVAALRGFLMPVVEGLLHMGTLPRTWQAGGPWQLKAEMAV